MSPAPGGKAQVLMPYPVVFYACEAVDEDSPPLSTNPFDRSNLGYDDPFGERTNLYHVDPILHHPARNERSAIMGHDLVLDLPIPVLDTEKAGLVEPMTALVVFLGSLWIAWKLFKPLRGRKDRAMGVDGKKRQ